MKAAAALLVLLGAALSPAHAELYPNWNVQADVQMVSLPVAEGRRLVPRLRQPETIAEAESRVQALLAGGEAELIGWCRSLGAAGTKFAAESVEEVKYETEFNFQGCPMFGPRIGTLTRMIEDEAESRQKKRNELPNTHAPTMFETRNVGPVLECEPVVDSDGRRIELTLVCQYARFEGIEPALHSTYVRPSVRNIPQPRFTSFITNTRLTMPNGGHVLLAAFVQEQPQPRLVLFLLHATAQRQPPTIP